jgi:hypothetical protein
MNIPSTLDRETFQQLLANAFAVQESQINPQSLSAIMEVQRSVASGKLSLDGAMTYLVESARNVANATGVAIGLLSGDQLTYRAGSGTSAAYIGQHVTASLTLSDNTKTNREILRVENAQTDTRIEADICRQFGAHSLLILPIYRDHAIAGVVDIRFSEPHAFHEREVRTYRLMAEQIEAALLQPAQPEQKANLAAELPPIPDALEQIPPSDQSFVPPPEFMMLPENEHSLYARCRAVLADVMELPGFKQSALLATMLTQRAKSISWPNRRRGSSPVAARDLPFLKRPAWLAATLTQRAKNLGWPNRWRNSYRAAAREMSSSFLKRPASLATTLAQRAKTLTWPYRWRSSSLNAARELSSVFKRSALLATMLAHPAKNLNWPNQRRSVALTAIAVVLAFTTLIAYKGSGPAKSLESSTLPSSSALDPHAPLPKLLPGKGASVPQPAPVAGKETRRASTALKRVRVGPNEVDYIAEDVTVRTFTDRPAAKRTRPPQGRVAHLGDDVTVRYFTPSPPATRTASR